MWSAGAPGALRSLLRTEFSRLRTELSPHQAVGLKPCAVGTNHAIWTAPTAPMTKNQDAISPGGLDSSLRRRADPQGKRPSRQGPPYRPRALSCRPHLSADFANGLNRLPGARGASATKRSAATGSLSLSSNSPAQNSRPAGARQCASASRPRPRTEVTATEAADELQRGRCRNGSVALGVLQLTQRV